MAKEIQGNLLDIFREPQVRGRSVSGYICHQCNCLSRGDGRGLARDIFLSFPEANVYRKRHSVGYYSTPGTVDVFMFEEVNVVNLYAQYSYRKSTKEPREKWFLMCLEKLATVVDQPVYFPWKIGCGLGGGDWAVYRDMIETFAEKVSVDVFIVKFTGNERL